MSNQKHHITSIFTLYYPFSFCIPPMAVLVIVRNALQGMRHSVAPLICSALEMIGKIIFALWLVPVYGYIAVCICEPVTWVKTIRHGYMLYPWRILLFLLILSLLYYNRFLSTPCGIVNLTINLLEASYSDIISLALRKSFDGLTCN